MTKKIEVNINMGQVPLEKQVEFFIHVHRSSGLPHVERPELNEMDPPEISRNHALCALKSNAKPDYESQLERDFNEKFSSGKLMISGVEYINTFCFDPKYHEMYK